jgi:hypothetical protein
VHQHDASAVTNCLFCHGSDPAALSNLMNTTPRDPLGDIRVSITTAEFSRDKTPNPFTCFEKTTVQNLFGQVRVYLWGSYSSPGGTPPGPSIVLDSFPEPGIDS